MSFRMSLATRLKLARVACEVTLPHDTSQLPSLIKAGAAVLFLRGYAEPRPWLGAPSNIVVGCDDPKLARELCVFGGGDPRWGEFAKRRPLGLKGQLIGNLEEAAQLPPDADFFTLSGPELVPWAVASHPPLGEDALPWFVSGQLDEAAVKELIAAGARRVWLRGAIEPGTVSSVDELLRRAWNRDPAAESYRRHALIG